MKKVLFFVSCAAFVAAMTMSCKNNAPAEEVMDSVVEEEIVEEEVVESSTEVVAASDAMSEAEHQAMINAAREAGQAKCNCYKTDAASVEACIKSILSEQYAKYQNNEEFKSVMEEEFNSCVKEKAAAATKEAANKAISAGANALSKKLGGNK